MLVIFLNQSFIWGHFGVELQCLEWHLKLRKIIYKRKFFVFRIQFCEISLSFEGFPFVCLDTGRRNKSLLSPPSVACWCDWGIATASGTWGEYLFWKKWKNHFFTGATCCGNASHFVTCGNRRPSLGTRTKINEPGTQKLKEKTRLKTPLFPKLVPRGLSWAGWGDDGAAPYTNIRYPHFRTVCP